ncbi:hypothetical protein TIFTF001_040953 [Ficus carica]|uniref:Uncharacterized protein n=1 Tax=Ficus carica TaxID=3494 RepID=A0AA87Z6Z5_FICCA|nr:hypothetical protein TIFTF001_040951 [Ficus carica]GMN27005.1 hypothetical protein TIFTF001_040953 [Ficus carica]
MPGFTGAVTSVKSSGSSNALAREAARSRSPFRIFVFFTRCCWKIQLDPVQRYRED